jgi:hypothetical protein
MKKTRDDDLGIEAPPKREGRPLSVRFSLENVRKLEALGKRLKVGPSTMARLIVEKFIKEHDPDR